MIINNSIRISNLLINENKLKTERKEIKRELLLLIKDKETQVLKCCHELFKNELTHNEILGRYKIKIAPSINETFTFKYVKSRKGYEAEEEDEYIAYDNTTYYSSEHINNTHCDLLDLLEDHQGVECLQILDSYNESLRKFLDLSL